MKGGSSSGRKTATFWSYFRVSRYYAAVLTNNVTFRQTVFKSKNQVPKNKFQTNSRKVHYATAAEYYAFSLSFSVLRTVYLVSFQIALLGFDDFSSGGKFLLYSVLHKFKQHFSLQRTHLKFFA